MSLGVGALVMLAGITRFSGTVLQVVRSKTKGITKSGLVNECGFIFLLPQFCKHPESAFERIAPPHRSLPILEAVRLSPKSPLSGRPRSMCSRRSKNSDFLVIKEARLSTVL